MMIDFKSVSDFITIGIMTVSAPKCNSITTDSMCYFQQEKSEMML